ncbi:MAG: hypothetical protein ABIH88_02420 [Patescibacteria group bacterium]|nr:hypothetical protein [Patescibacteria group bacterium]
MALKENEAIIDQGIELGPEEKVVAEIEGIWEKFSLGSISSEEKNAELEGILTRTEEDHPEILAWLEEENDEGVTKLVEIRDKVMPSRSGRWRRVA